MAKDSVKENDIKKEKKVKEAPKKETKKSKKWLIIVILIFLIAFVAGILFFVFKNKDTSFKEYTMLFVDNEKLVYWEKDSDKRIILDDSYSTYDNSFLEVAYANNSDTLFAYVNDSSLYLVDTKKKSKELITTDVAEYEYTNYKLAFSKDDKYLVYIDEDNNVYTYDIAKKNKNKIITVKKEETSYFIAVLEDKVIFDVSDADSKYTIYSYKYDSDKPTKVVEKSDGYRINSDYTKIIYTLEIKNEKEEFAGYEYWVYDMTKEKAEKVISNARRVPAYNDDLTKIFYLVPSANKSVILDDDELNNDPVTKVEKSKVCDYSDYYDDKCSYDDWIYNREYKYTEETSKKSVNDEIRAYASELETLDLYYYENGKSELLVENVTTVYDGNADEKIVAYAKVNESVKISTLTSLDDFKEFVAKNTKVYYLNQEEIDVTLEQEKVEYLLIDGKKGYLNTEEGNLYYLDLNKKSKDLELVDTDFYAYVSYYNDNIVYSTNYNEGDGTRDYNYVDGSKSITLGSDANFVVGPESSKKLYVAANCEEGMCEYFSFDGKRLEKYFPSAHNIFFLNDTNLYTIENYDEYDDKGDLYRYIGKKAVLIAKNIDPNYTSLLRKEKSENQETT